MTISTNLPYSGKAKTLKKTFSRTTSVGIQIDADPSIVWALLTNSTDFSRWNSTVVSIDGDIKKGEKISLISALSPERTFLLRVKEFIPEQKLVWGDALGERSYRLKKTNEGTAFYMTEKIGGPIFPLFASKIPSFDDSFEQFAEDLKTEAETISNS